MLHTDFLSAGFMAIGPGGGARDRGQLGTASETEVREGQPWDGHAPALKRACAIELEGGNRRSASTAGCVLKSVALAAMLSTTRGGVISTDNGWIGTRYAPLPIFRSSWISIQQSAFLVPLPANETSLREKDLFGVYEGYIRWSTTREEGAETTAREQPAIRIWLESYKK